MPHRPEHYGMPRCIQNLFMKTIIYLLGLLAVVATSGCAYHHDHDRDHRGGAYDRSYRDYGRDRHTPVITTGTTITITTTAGR